MRMWIGVEPWELCMQHLSGEHGEIHKHRHNFEKGHRITGRIEGNAIEPQAMKERHDLLEAELRRRAIEAGRRPPSSPYELPDLSYLPKDQREFRIDQDKNGQPAEKRLRSPESYSAGSSETAVHKRQRHLATVIPNCPRGSIGHLRLLYCPLRSPARRRPCQGPRAAIFR